MDRKQMSLAEAMALLERKGCFLRVYGKSLGLNHEWAYLCVPEKVHMGLKAWSAFDRIGHEMDITYMFEKDERRAE